MVSCNVSLLGNVSFVKTPWVLFQILNFDSQMFVGFAISAIEPQQTDQPGRWNAWNENEWKHLGIFTNENKQT